MNRHISTYPFVDREYVPDIGGVSMESLMASAVARMVRKKREILAALLVSSRFFTH